MYFNITLNLNQNGYNFKLPNSSNKPDDFLKLCNSYIAALDNQIRLFNQVINEYDLSSNLGKEKLANTIIASESYPLNVLNTTMYLGLLSERRLDLKQITIKPSNFQVATKVDVVSKNIISKGTQFDAKEVIMQCDDRLYLENNNFNNAKVIINDRVLTKKEVNHISSDVTKKCPLKIALELWMSQDEMSEISNLLEAFSNRNDLEELTLESIIDAQQTRDELASTLEEHDEAFSKCKSDFVDKIVDIDCYDVDAFDFMAI